ncbi:hypothetical protein EKH57_02085 [Halorubrum sp. BOL3-1]|nr:hypothetical protein EKH57_02085 [Halorubrum sp. BOL3-1]
MILFGGVPLGPGFLILILLVGLVVTFLVSNWVYKDAKKRGSSQPFLWGGGIGILTVLFLPLGVAALVIYLILRTLN